MTPQDEFDDYFASHFAEQPQQGIESPSILGFRIQPIWQTILGGILPEKAMTLLILLIIFLKFIHYVSLMVRANINLQRVVLYRSQFYFVGDSFIRLDDFDDGAKQKTQLWYITRPVMVNQFAKICFACGLFVCNEGSRIQFYVCGTGLLAWVLVNVLWNKLFMLFSKPNLAYIYQGKQWCLMNSYFFLSLTMISFFWMDTSTLMASPHEYSGPMHVVGFQVQPQETDCSPYSFLRRNETRPQRLPRCHMEEFQPQLEVAWGGRWGCPKSPGKHCQATVDLTLTVPRSQVPDHRNKLCHFSLCKIVMTNKRPFHAVIHPCTMLVPIESNTSSSYWYSGDTDNGVCVVNSTYTLNPIPATAPICPLKDYRKDPRYIAENCVTHAFPANFDNETHALKKPMSAIRSSPPKAGDARVTSFVGDCNTCTVQEKTPKKIFGPPMLFVLCYAMNFLSLVGWAALSLLTRWVGWGETTPDSLVVHPVEPMPFLDFFFLTMSFF